MRVQAIIWPKKYMTMREGCCGCEQHREMDGYVGDVIGWGEGRRQEECEAGERRLMDSLSDGDD